VPLKEILPVDQRAPNNSLQRAAERWTLGAFAMHRVLALLLLFLTACSGPIGEQFADVDSIGMSETWRDWVIVGRFGPSGPFALVDVKSCEVDEPCSFSHDGQGHTYNQFYGYKLTVLRLENSQGQVSHVVLRSKQKFDGRA
jgi:hypothetical protein